MNWENTFLLMNKDREILSFKTIKNKYGSVNFEIISEKNEPHPLGFENLADWLEKRQAPKHRAHIERLLRVCGCYDLDGFIRVTRAMTLNDTFWIKPEKSGLVWNEVSLYQNPFNDTIAKIAFEGGLYGEGFSTTSPEFGTDGTYAKCWIRKDDKDIYLLKRGTSGARNAGLEPYSEYYASQVSGQICKDHISYDLVKHHGKLASSCKLFTSEKTGFVPIWKALGKTSDPEKLLSYFDSIGSGEAFRRMVVFDALILNTDRHTGNYGVLVDNDSQEVLKM
ncbi:MAG: HipA protein, partial [Bacillota bacterium]|nr:HipA protein [Bacillota bacterium]